MRKPELLAPAGDMETLKAAVIAGADAIYLGGKDFNARRNANNFTREEIQEAVIFCHLFDVKVYVTMNILIKDHEIEEAMEYVYFLYIHHVDALIVQDLGLFYLIKRQLPQFCIHSSTQMFIHSLYGVQLLEGMGFDRIVLARELTHEEIKNIVDHTFSEIKIFNHGAMCICYSGQCLMSSMIGGRSGNRGNCAQPCRKQYQLTYEGRIVDDGHLLSPKDLSTVEIFPQIMEIGAHSLKIEGRKKNKFYVYTIVSAYRKLIDAYVDGITHPLTQMEKGNMLQVFNRQFTQGYFEKEKLSSQELIIKDSPKSRGIPIGHIYEVEKNRVRIKLTRKLHVGDAIRITGKGIQVGEKISILYNTKGEKVLEGHAGERVSFISQNKVKSGSTIDKIQDIQLEKGIEEKLKKIFPYRIPIQGDFKFYLNRPILANGQWKEYHVDYVSDFVIEKALYKPLVKERVIGQLSKLGNTPFYFDRLNIDLDNNINIPVAELNKVRRSIVEQLTNKKISSVREPVKGKVDFSFEKTEKPKMVPKQKLVIKTSRLPLLKEVLKLEVDEIIYGGNVPFDLVSMEEAVKLCRKNGKRILLSFPSVTRKTYLDTLMDHMNKINDFESDGVLVGNYELLSLFRHSHMRIEADHTLNVFNVYALEQLKRLNISLAYLSLELNRKEISKILQNSPIELGMIVYGNVELMISEYALLHPLSKSGHIKDTKGFCFPVRVDAMGRTHIYNSKKLSLIDELQHLKHMKSLRMDFMYESIDEVYDIIEGYSKQLKGNDVLKKYPQLTTLDSNITKGHFYRGV
ncbi:MAG: DUF3656 domain-containing U32 family peptidase [Eubacteriales bacterium]